MTMKRQNVNRGYMKLEVWQRALDLFKLVFGKASVVRDWKLQSQINDAAQSVSSNIAEGYCRRSLPEYLQYLYIAKGSLGETLTRAIGLNQVQLLTDEALDAIDCLHYEVENKLLNLIKSLEKLPPDSWQTKLP